MQAPNEPGPRTQGTGESLGEYKGWCLAEWAVMIHLTHASSSGYFWPLSSCIIAKTINIKRTTTKKLHISWVFVRYFKNNTSENSKNFFST